MLSLLLNISLDYCGKTYGIYRYIMTERINRLVIPSKWSKCSRSIVNSALKLEKNKCLYIPHGGKNFRVQLQRMLPLVVMFIAINIMN